MQRLISLQVAATRMTAVAVLFTIATPTWAADSDTEIVRKIDEFIRQGWTENEITPSPRASEGEFARRVALDTIGHIPDYSMLMDFLEDESKDKRIKYVNQLLEHENYIKNSTNLWANLLIGRGNNRGTRAQLERWLRNCFYRNVPYNKFVFDLVSAEGSSGENGAVNFLANHLNNQAIPATSITSRIFLGLQVQCTQCHNHPFNEWKQSQFWSMNAFFRGARRNGRGATMSLTDGPSPRLVQFEKRSGLQQAAFREFVDGTRVQKKEDEKPRLELAKLIIDPSKPYMARTQVNRIWGQFFGFGFTRPIDDMGPHNAPTHPELLDYLAKEFAAAGYDVKRLITWVTASEAYNLTSKFNDENRLDNPASGTIALFSHMYVKQFSAEQLYDSLIIATAAHKANRNEEAAEKQRQTWLRQFVQTFGTDENDESTSFNGTIPQALVMMNGALTNTALGGGEGAFLRRLLESPTGDIRETKDSKKRKTRRRPTRATQAKAIRDKNRRKTRNMPRKIETLFMVALARKPSESELQRIDGVFREGENRDAIEALQDVFWAVLNSNEFIMNH